MRESIKAYSAEKAFVKKILRDANFEDIKVSNGYYYFTGFAKKNNQTIYYSISDVRQNHNHETLLIRTAKDYKDYTGGSNNFCSLDKENIQELANRLTK